MIIGIDVGGTNVRIGLVGCDYSLQNSCEVVSSRRFCMADHPIEEFGNIILKYIKKHEISKVDAISIGVPATVKTDFRTIYVAPNLKNAEGKPIFDHKNLAAELEERFQCSVYINKDVNNLLYYDVYKNQMDGIVAGCYIGTGIGSAVIIDGNLLYGKNGVAMDMGHVSLFRDNENCSCGKRGCAETRGSGKALMKMWENYYSEYSINEIFTIYGQEKRIRQFISDCAHIPAIMAATFNPKYMVCGGGVIEMQDFPRRFFEEEILRQTTPAVASFPPTFFYSEKQEERGVIGAAYFAEMMRKNSNKNKK